jgi:hypothetical protein
MKTAHESNKFYSEVERDPGQLYTVGVSAVNVAGPGKRDCKIDLVPVSCRIRKQIGIYA